MVNLTEGVCAFDSPTYHVASFVQVLSIHKLPNSKGFERHKLVVSDGVHFRSAILAKHLDQLITCQQILELCVIQMEDFVLTRDEESEQVISFFSIVNWHLICFFSEYFLFQALKLLKQEKKSLATHKLAFQRRMKKRKKQKSVSNADHQQMSKQSTADIISVWRVQKSKGASTVACW